MGWSQNWALLHSEYLTLVQFFDDNQGGKFDYTHIITDDTFKLQFIENSLPEATPVSNTHWTLTGLKFHGVSV